MDLHQRCLRNAGKTRLVSCSFVLFRNSRNFPEKNSHYHGEGIGYIKEGVNGFLASDGNVNEITEIMNRIISDKELSEKLKHNAFETAKNDCSVDKMLDGFDSAINYVMKN